MDDDFRLRQTLARKGYVRIHKFFTIKIHNQGYFWDYERRKKGKIYTCWSEEFNLFDECFKDLEDFYKRLCLNGNEEDMVTSQIVKVKLLERINPQKEDRL